MDNLNRKKTLKSNTKVKQMAFFTFGAISEIWELNDLLSKGWKVVSNTPQSVTGVSWHFGGYLLILQK